ncbi:protein kinase [Plasmodium gonderi]|uniref:Protein kinase n=1 Tax=Plasmodium gonderi TaxID=77519 RepID=A0A1Y1JHX7_PLAGO|nr:protein kinase [Plasmodium gonderi]GAW79694.1 protein kinase [Plasmodium gonderi]
MDLIKIYKKNEILKDYVNIYLDDDKLKNVERSIKYKILHIIGNGVYGVVYKACCLENLCVVALKQTYQKNTRIFKEIEIMKKLRHPNIVKLKHAFYTTSSYGGVYVHMIMEYGNTDLATSLYYISIKNSPEHVNHLYDTSDNQDIYVENGNLSHTYGENYVLHHNKFENVNFATNKVNVIEEEMHRCPKTHRDDAKCADEETHNGETHNGETHNGETHNGETHNGETHNGETHNGETHNGETHNGETHNGETHNGETHNGETHNEGTDNNNEKPYFVDTSNQFNHGKVSIPSGENQHIHSTSIRSMNSVRKSGTVNNFVNIANDDLLCNNAQWKNKLKKKSLKDFNLNALEGRSLRHICPDHNITEYIKNSFLNENQIKIYLYQLIRATLYLHSLCITHRDIKPQNILIFLNKEWSNNDTTTLQKNQKEKECLVCIQNSVKVRYIMDRKQGRTNRAASSARNPHHNQSDPIDLNNRGGPTDPINHEDQTNLNSYGNLTELTKLIDSTNYGDLTKLTELIDPTDRTDPSKVQRKILTKHDYNMSNEHRLRNNRNYLSNRYKKSTPLLSNLELENKEEPYSFDVKDKWISSHHNRSNNRKVENCYTFCSRSSTPLSCKSVKNHFKKQDVRLKRSLSVVHLFKDKQDIRSNKSYDSYSHSSKKISNNDMKKKKKKKKVHLGLAHSYANVTMTDQESVKLSKSYNTIRKVLSKDSPHHHDASATHCENDSPLHHDDTATHCKNDLQLHDKSICHNFEKFLNESEKKQKEEILQSDKVHMNDKHDEPEKNNPDTLYMNNIMYKYIKLCDFNISIKLKENYKYFSYVCSRYYRAPELLFGSNHYSQAIDTWSIGCVMGELILGKPLFLGDCASDQLVEIIKVLGTPNDEDVLSFRSGHKDVKFPQVKPITLKELIKNQSSQESIDLLGKLLQFNPQKRIKLCSALLHTYFDDIRNLNVFKKDMNSDNSFTLPYITNCFNFTKEELLHFTVEERKILVPLEVRRRKVDEVMQYIDMTLEAFDKLYPNKVHLAC